MVICVTISHGAKSQRRILPEFERSASVDVKASFQYPVCEGPRGNTPALRPRAVNNAIATLVFRELYFQIVKEISTCMDNCMKCTRQKKIVKTSLIIKRTLDRTIFNMYLTYLSKFFLIND